MAPELKRGQGTPIIVVPAAATALINMYNAQQLLQVGVSRSCSCSLPCSQHAFSLMLCMQHGRFVPPEQARAGYVKPDKLTLQRKDAHGNDCQYYVIDNVGALQPHEW
jgi:hypothetical protein